MVTPRKGVYDTLTLNAEGPTHRGRVGPGQGRSRRRTVPGLRRGQHHAAARRLHITWQDANTLRIETDTGTQTRTFHFGTPARTRRTVVAGTVDRAVGIWAPGRGNTAAGDLKVVTTNLRPGYVRKNGAPYSAKTVVTEYFDLNTMPNNDQWLTVTTNVEDPVYFARHYVTTTDFKKLPDAKGWNPTPCSAR